jgi:hypothetical protein
MESVRLNATPFFNLRVSGSISASTPILGRSQKSQISAPHRLAADLLFSPPSAGILRTARLAAWDTSDNRDLQKKVRRG